MDKNGEVLYFLREFRMQGYAALNKKGEEFDVSKALLSELSNMGFELYTIKFMTLKDGVWKKCSIYCMEEFQDAAIGWILDQYSLDENSSSFEEMKKTCACVKCHWNDDDSMPNFVIPVKLLTSIQVEKYDEFLEENYLNNFEFESIV